MNTQVNSFVIDEKFLEWFRAKFQYFDTTDAYIQLLRVSDNEKSRKIPRANHYVHGSVENSSMRIDGKPLVTTVSILYSIYKGSNVQIPEVFIRQREQFNIIYKHRVCDVCKCIVSKATYDSYLKCTYGDTNKGKPLLCPEHINSTTNTHNRSQVSLTDMIKNEQDIERKKVNVIHDGYRNNSRAIRTSLSRFD
jgi:hypothetical protein